MSRSATRHRTLALALATGLNTGVLAAGYEFPVAGVNPAERPAGAPILTEFNKDRAWYDQALRGISRPYPASLRFLEYQGAWHTPFNRPGMPPPYDIRGWHTN